VELAAPLVPASADGAERAAASVARSAGLRVRELHTNDELRAVYRLYDSIWRPDPRNPPVTSDLLRAMTKAGNYVAGAFDGDLLVGACVGFFSAPAEGALHSHIAGVPEQRRGRNVGFALKLHQRGWALRRGVRTISWTFDPLVRRNAYFNLGKLGAAAGEYLPNFYGGMHDAINGTDDSDRLLVRWELSAPRVVAACAGVPPDAGLSVGGRVVLSVADDGSPQFGPAGIDAVDALEAPLLVATPPDIEAMRATDAGRAHAWRLAVRDTLGALLARGARVTGFERAGWYVLTGQPAVGSRQR
jgi:predicted GNAT superfamily acetyltransferase